MIKGLLSKPVAVPPTLQSVEMNTTERRLVEPLFLDIWAVDKFYEYNVHKHDIVSQLKAGDEVWLKTDTQGYSHVLLYIGNEEVVHVSDVNKSGFRLGKTIVTRDNLNDVAEDKLIGCRKTGNLDDAKREVIIQRALGDVGKYFPYLLTTDNCEHQVKYWISGVKDYRWIVSTQVRDHVVIGLISFLVGAGIGAGLVLYLWSTDIFPILVGTLGGGVLSAVVIVGFKYLASSLEYRKAFRGH